MWYVKQCLMCGPQRPSCVHLMGGFKDHLKTYDTYCLWEPYQNPIYIVYATFFLILSTTFSLNVPTSPISCIIWNPKWILVILLTSRLTSFTPSSKPQKVRPFGPLFADWCLQMWSTTYRSKEKHDPQEYEKTLWDDG